MRSPTGRRAAAVHDRTATVTINVDAVNDAPATFDIPNQAIDSGHEQRRRWPSPSRHDEPGHGDALTGVSSNHDARAERQHRVRRQRRGAHGHGDAGGRTHGGTAVITVTAIDAGGADRQDTFTLTVRRRCGLHVRERAERAGAAGQDLQGGQRHPDAVAVRRAPRSWTAAQVHHDRQGAVDRPNGRSARPQHAIPAAANSGTRRRARRGRSTCRPRTHGATFPVGTYSVTITPRPRSPTTFRWLRRARQRHERRTRMPVEYRAAPDRARRCGMAGDGRAD